MGRRRYTRPSHAHLRVRLQSVRTPVRDRAVDARRRRSPICPECGGELRKVFAPPAISFKGSGFYATDQGRRPPRREARRRERREGREEVGRRASSGPTGRRPGSGSGDGKKDSTSDAPAASSAKETSASSSGSSSGSTSEGRASTRDDRRHRGLRRLRLLLVPRRHRDRRGRDALRPAERPPVTIGDVGGRAGGVPPAARLEARVPAASHPLPGERLGDEGARRGAGARARTRAARCSRT